MLLPEFSVNQMVPSCSAIMPEGLLPAVGIANSVIVPVGVTRPSLLAAMSNSVNQIEPSGAAVMANGLLCGVGIGNSVMVPEGVMRPILLPSISVNQRSP